MCRCIPLGTCCSKVGQGDTSRLHQQSRLGLTKVDPRPSTAGNIRDDGGVLKVRSIGVVPSGAFPSHEPASVPTHGKLSPLKVGSTVPVDVISRAGDLAAGEYRIASVADVQGILIAAKGALVE